MRVYGYKVISRYIRIQEESGHTVGSDPNPNPDPDPDPGPDPGPNPMWSQGAPKRR